MVDTAFVLAGGLGTRLRPIVSDVPKPMARVAGRPFLEHLFDYLLAQGVDHIVLCVGYLGNVVQDYFGYSYRGRRISYSFEEEPTGTGGALSKALQDFELTDLFLVCNGDTFFPIDTSLLLDVAQGQSWAIATFRAHNFRRYGALSIASNGSVEALLSEVGNFPSPGTIGIQANSGVWIGNPQKISLPLLVSETAFSLEDYLTKSLRDGSVTAMAQEFDATFIDIGLPKDFARAQTLGVFCGD